MLCGNASEIITQVSDTHCIKRLRAIVNVRHIMSILEDIAMSYLI